jgi:preprotein translocase subunit SecE
MTLSKAINFLKECKAELSRVTWPTREAIIGGTLVVILVSLVLVFFMWAIDLLITRILSLFLR